MRSTYRLVLPSELDKELISSWRSIQEANEHLASPYFCPEFTQLVGQVRDDVKVLVLQDGAKPVCFFPYQKSRFAIGKPVAGPFSDYHGLISNKEDHFNIQDMLRAAGLRLWDFDHVPACMSALVPHATSTSSSPVIELSTGYSDYLQRFRESGSSYVTRSQSKARKLEREVGDLNFSFHDGSEEVIQQAIEWKNSQFQRSSGMSVFRDHPWTGKLLRSITQKQTDHFSGVCSVLRAGEQIVAIHLGMRSRDVLHWWFPTYNSAFHKYSPGTILLLRTAQAAESAKIKRIDLGKGLAHYKNSAMTHEIPLIEGTMQRPTLITSWRAVARFVKLKSEQGSVVASGLNIPFRALRRHARLNRFL